MLKTCQNTLVLQVKNTRLTTNPPSPQPPPYPLPFSLHRVYIQNFPCMLAPRAHVENTCARGARHTRGFQRFTHHTHHTPQPTTTTRPPHHTETDTQSYRDKERRGDEREVDKRIEERRVKREDSFSVWWCMAVLY